jgi:hypothetical protein
MPAMPSAALVRAFRATLYRVQGPPAFTVRCGQPSAALRRWMRSAAATNAAMLTAFNPGALPRSAAANRRAQARLLKDLRSLRPLGLRRGRNLAANGAWPPEDALWVLGPPLGLLQRLGRAYGQAALLYCGPSARPRLLWL